MKSILVAICSAFILPVSAALHAVEGIAPTVYYGSEHAVTAGDKTVELAVIVIYTHRSHAKVPFIEGAFRSLRVPKSLLVSCIKKGSPLLLNETLWALAMALLTQCYSFRGLSVVASMNISNTISNVFNATLISMGSAIGILLGQELGMGQQFLQFPHTHQRGQGLPILQVEAEIVLHTLDIQDIVEKDTLQFILTLDEDDTVAEERILLHLDTKPTECLLGGTEKVLIRYRLQQVIDCIDLEPLYGILRKSRCEDNTCIFWQNPGKLDATEFRHLDVEEKQLCRIVAQALHSGQGTVVNTYQFQIGRLRDITLQQAGCQWLIVDNSTLNCHNLILIVD